jgi:hypothetical protein
MPPKGTHIRVGPTKFLSLNIPRPGDKKLLVLGNDLDNYYGYLELGLDHVKYEVYKKGLGLMLTIERPSSNIEEGFVITSDQNETREYKKKYKNPSYETTLSFSYCPSRICIPYIVFSDVVYAKDEKDFRFVTMSYSFE